jgi:Ca2+-binding EF-hand superfamily protein
VARDISADRIGCSVSFNEYLTMMGNQKNTEPTPESLLDAFQLFDKKGEGRITVVHFRRIMMCKMGDDVLELEEMLEEYRCVDFLRSLLDWLHYILWAAFHAPNFLR